jgi:hypothetical protein
MSPKRIVLEDLPTLAAVDQERQADGSATAAATVRRLIIEAVMARRSARVAKALADATASVAGNHAPPAAPAPGATAPPSGASEPAPAQEAA